MNTAFPHIDAYRAAEFGLLGNLIANDSSIDDIAEIVQVKDFYTDAGQRIYGAMLELRQQRVRISNQTIAEALTRKGAIEDVGGFGFIGELFDLGGAGSEAFHFARIVKDHAIRRQTYHAANEVMRLAAECDVPVGELRELTESAINGIESQTDAKAYPIAEAIGEEFDRIDGQQKGLIDLSGIPTGFIDLDDVIIGLRKNEVTILGARTSVGKTALGANITVNILKAHKAPILFVSLEQSREEITRRMICSEARIDSQRVAKNIWTDGERRLYYETGSMIRELPLYLVDRPNVTMAGIGTIARRLKRRAGIKLIVIDYLQKVTSDLRGVSTYERVTDISGRLKNLARDLELPVLCLCQLNRATDGRPDGKPKLSDLRESGAIEQDADTVVLLNRADGDANRIEINVAKNRNGRIGQVSLTFLPMYTRFENYVAGFPI